jgi:hypothetical protein
MPYQDDEFSNPVRQDLTEGLMMPTAELGTPLIAAVLLVVGLATYLSLGSSRPHFNPATNTAHLRATLRTQDEDLRHAGSIRPTTPDS